MYAAVAGHVILVATATDNDRRMHLCLNKTASVHLQEVRELGVTVGHVLCLAADSRNAVCESREAEVDVLRLLQPLVSRPNLPQPLTARQVDKPQLGRDLTSLHKQRANLVICLVVMDD
jgi:hypothetical protein